MPKTTINDEKGVLAQAGSGAHIKGNCLWSGALYSGAASVAAVATGGAFIGSGPVALITSGGYSRRQLERNTIGLIGDNHAKSKN